ncbi:winged helix-turn-helix domain-containing protein [Rubritalea marina]|uniref:winged helix-turn-helix domain-containing protein n=1 Tax=Rubritalea marina TaxID=361055 RepID=UPI00047649EB|nr:response regulator transcription factor [Rubritalea marina]
MKVLIAESDRQMREQLVSSLRQAKYVVDVVGDGEEALYMMKNYPYLVVLLADDLRGEGALDVLKQARAAKVRSCIMMLGATKSPAVRVQGLDSGADDYMVKPPNLEELKARVRVMVRRQSLEGNSLIKVSDVEFDQNSGRVMKGGEEVLLTGREFKILKVLLMHLGTVVPKSLVYDAIESEYEHSMSNLLEVHLCSLRKKLGKDFILTFRGRGYMIDRD